MDGSAIGIDFGTSNTVAVIGRVGRPAEPLLFDGSPLMPSAVYASDGRILAGRVALRSAAIDPTRCEPYPKRCVDHGTVLLGESEYGIVDLFRAVFERVADEARRVLGGVPERVVVTHPVAWSTRRRRTLRMAVEAADLPTPEQLAEPVAAAGYFLEHHRTRLREGDRFLVYDLGGGTCDLTVVRRVGERVEVVATDGIEDAGGTYVDAAIVEYLERTHPGADGEWDKLREPRDKGDRRHRRMLWDDVREAKEVLSRSSSAEMYIPLLDADVHVTRDEIAALADQHLRPTIALAASMVAQHGGVAGILLAGGASRMPLVASELLRATGIAPVLVEQPELVVASGALRSVASAVTMRVPAPVASPGPQPVSPPPLRTEPPVEPVPPPDSAVKQPIPPRDAGISAVAINPDGRMWAYMTEFGLRVWDPVAGIGAPFGDLSERRFTGLNGEKVAWSPSGAVLALAYPGQGIELINRHVAGAKSLDGHRAPVTALAWSPDGEYLATGTSIGEVFIRRSWGGSVARSPTATPGTFSRPLGSGGIAHLTWSPDGSQLAVVGVNSGSCVWHDGSLTPRPDVTELAWLGDDTLIEVTVDNRLRRHHTASGHTEDLLGFGEQKATSLRASPDGTGLAALLDDGRGLGAQWRWMPTRQLDVVLPLARAGNSSLSWTPDGEFLVTADGGGRNPVNVTSVRRARWMPRGEASR